MKRGGRPGGLPEGALAQVSNVVCVGSGKGGVGKSTVTANLAAALDPDTPFDRASIQTMRGVGYRLVTDDG